MRKLALALLLAMCAIPTLRAQYPAAHGTTADSYTGPNSEWVQKILTTAGSYSCAPQKAPSFPSTFACAGRDGYVYSAQQLAWLPSAPQKPATPTTP